MLFRGKMADKIHLHCIKFYVIDGRIVLAYNGAFNDEAKMYTIFFQLKCRLLDHTHKPF